MTSREGEGWVIKWKDTEVNNHNIAVGNKSKNEMNDIKKRGKYTQIVYYAIYYFFKKMNLSTIHWNACIQFEGLRANHSTIQ